MNIHLLIKDAADGYWDLRPQTFDRERYLKEEWHILKKKTQDLWDHGTIDENKLEY